MAVNNEEGADEVFLLSTLCAKLQLCLTHAQQENAALQQENISLRHQLQQSTSICKPTAAPAWVAHQQPALQPYEAWTLHADGSASEPARHGMIEFIESEIRNLQEQLLATRRKLDDAQCGDNAHASAGQPQGSPYMSGRFEDLDLSPNYAGLNRHQRRSGHYQAEVLTVARKGLCCGKTVLSPASQGRQPRRNGQAAPPTDAHGWLQQGNTRVRGCRGKASIQRTVELLHSGLPTAHNRR
ncbi:hypothetical protein V8C86DRAFT_606201 [Haematococcus lacustris]